MLRNKWWVGIAVMLSASACRVSDVDVDGIFGNHDSDDTPTDNETESDSTEENETDGTDDNISDPTPVDGVDILVIVDNSGSMTEEQQILSTAAFTLVNGLTNPVSGSSALTPTSVRLGVVTSDMGLQYGSNRETAQIGAPVNSCFDPRGDDGALQRIPEHVTSVHIESDVIPCEADGNQCPESYTCVDGYCAAPDGVSIVNCPVMGDDDFLSFSDQAGDEPGPAFATAAACLVQQGTEGCGIEQQLSAATRALEVNSAEFLVASHALQVVIVSDEEDCSVKDPGLYNTTEWLSGPGQLLNVACNYPESNNDYLFTTADIKTALIDAKGGDADSVMFAGIVGVPVGSACEGFGTELDGCLDEPSMQLQLEEFETADGNVYTHLTPACTRVQNGVEVTLARPGRRYVDLAQKFGDKGYIYSICNNDWGPAMEDIAQAAIDRILQP